MHQTVKQFLNYIEYEKRYSPHTLQSYENDLVQFRDFLATNTGNDMPYAQHFEIRNWIVSMMQSGITARSVNRKISTLKSYYKFLLRRGEIKKNPLAKVLNPKTSKKLPSFVEQTAMENLFSQVEFCEGFEGDIHKMILELLYGTGIRRSELINLKESDIDLYQSQIKVLGKGNKERIIPVHQELMATIKRFVKAKSQSGLNHKDGYLIVNMKGNKLTPPYVYATVKKYLSQITTVDKRSPHTLRHTFATHLMNKGAEINAVKELLGHSSLAATQVYTHNTIDKLKNIHKQAHPRG